jgi:hypothetical protein
MGRACGTHGREDKVIVMENIKGLRERERMWLI